MFADWLHQVLGGMLLAWVGASLAGLCLFMFLGNRAPRDKDLWPDEEQDK